MSGEDDARAGAANAAQLRAKIDAGQASDKVPFPDPAAAPLGTDDEAAGTPPPNAATRAAMARETTRAAPTKAPDRTGPWVWALVLAAVLVVAAAVAVLYWPAA